MSESGRPMILMMAGGTGGHVYPALAVATELLDRGFRVQWVGTARGLESRVVPEADIKLNLLSVRGVRGKSMLSKLAGVAYLGLSCAQALYLVLRLAPGCVIGLGGYVAGPAGVAAWLLRKPLVIHEQNAVAGTTNRLLAPFARRILAAFPGAFQGEQDYTVVGNPVRRSLLERASSSSYDYAGQRPLRLLVVGGSLGAKPLNDVLPVAVSALRQGDERASALEVWHQTGEDHIAGVRDAYGSSLKQGVKVSAFIEDMAAAYSWADLVLCRAGALTVSELAIMGRPAILVPLPQAIDDHQSANARFLCGPGAAVLLPQGEMSVERVAELLQGFLREPQRLVDMAGAARAAATPAATQSVCDCAEEVMRGC